MMDAEKFYKGNLTRQRKVLGQRIHEAWVAGDPVIRLPFKVYPVIEKEMEEKEYACMTYTDYETGRECTAFCVKQYLDEEE